MTKVHCTVNDCEYWADNNYCSADEIIILGKSGSLNAQDIDNHGRGSEQAPQTPVEREDGTWCHTFERE